MTTLQSAEILARAEEIFRKEGKYLEWIRWKQRNPKKAAAMLEDLFDRYGQKLDGNLTDKYQTDLQVEATRKDGKKVKLKYEEK